MKIKKLATYAKQNGKTAWLMTARTDEGDALRQYVYCGSSIYPLDGLGRLDAEMLKTVFDVTGDEREDWAIGEREMTDALREIMEDNAPGDVAMRMIGLKICANGMEVEVLADENDRNATFIDRDALKPVDDVEERTLWLREVGDVQAVVVKSGFMNVAAIGTYNARGMAEGLMMAGQKAWNQMKRWENEREAAGMN